MLAGVFLAAAVVSVSVRISMFYVGRAVLQTQSAMATQLGVLKQLESFVSTLKDLETGQRGYLLTGDESYLEPYHQGLSQLRARLDGLRGLAAQGHLAEVSVTQLDRLTQTQLNELEETVRLRREQGLEAAMGIVRSGRGKQLMDQIRALVGGLQQGAEAQFAESGQRLRSAERVRMQAYALGGVLSLVFLGWMFGKLSREMGRREVSALEASRQKELLFTTITCIGDGVIATDIQGRITSMNPEAERLTGWKSAEAQGQPLHQIFRIVNEDTRQPVENPVEKVFRLGTVVGLANHTLLLARDGTETPIDDSAAPIRAADGSLFGVVLVFRDFSEHRQAEELRSRLAAIIECAGDAILSKDLAGVIQTWNSSAEQLFGYRAEEILGRPITLLVPPERQREEQEILERLRQGQPVERMETVRIAKDGHALPVRLSVSPIRNREGRIIGASTMVHDVSELKRVESELRQARDDLSRTNADLEKTVEERTARLREMISELQHFSYAIVHDMRAPLRAMQAFAQILQEHMDRETLEEPRDLARRIMTAANRLDRLIQDALSYNQAVLREMPLTPVDLSRLLPDLVETYPNLHASQADIDIQPGLPVVLGNEALLTECFSNLLANAVKFVPKGTRPHVQVRCEHLDGTVRLSVQDNGIGIGQPAQARLFGMFQRLTNDYEGTGIGLAIVRKVVERMQGRVGVESEPGRGSRFWVELRLATPATTPPARLNNIQS